MKSNFTFLKKKWILLFSLGNMAERYVYSDANSCLMKLGLFGENVVSLMLKLDNIEEPTENIHVNKIKKLKREGLLPRDIDDILYSLRMARNKAAHEGYGTTSKTLILLELTFKLGVWFMQTYGEWNYEPEKYIVPKDTSKEIDYNKIIAEQESKIKELSKKVKSKSEEKVSLTDRKNRANESANKILLTEKETRYLIDEQLKKVGWEVNSEYLTYSKGVRPQKNKNLAISEWPTNSLEGNGGRVDYALFVGTKLYGVVEAKRLHTDISSVLDYQCRDYAKYIKEEHEEYILGKWNKYQVPFLFATNGRKYLEQLKTKSGIWFLDSRRSYNIPKALRGWMSPSGLKDLYDQDIEMANKELKETKFDLLKDKDGLNLRDYQLEAIQEVENTIINGKNEILIAMATGTGKTRTILGMIYRFIKMKRFNRILFLVDRTALGEQAEEVFKEVKIEDLMTINEIYNIKNLDDKEIEKETNIHIATVQSLVKRIIYNQGDKIPAVSDYDLIIVDEAHRGYILDKEMGEEELEYRNQDDYLSKYKTVIEYFNATKIALTATPALHTTQIFGMPVYNYNYRKAVIDGWLVDHDAPHKIKTQLSTEGIHYKKGENVTVIDSITQETAIANLKDELDFDIESFNKKVVVESFNRVVLEEIADQIDPTSGEKTLIFAANDAHADLIVNILKEIFETYDINSEAVMKITGSVGGGNKKKVNQAIKKFKNEKYPSVVVTVDLLTTGIDVPKITSLVFLRRVKSRILFEQMLGRATRLCPELDKDHFEIFDPVGVYESLESVSTMKPVVVNPETSYNNLIDGLKSSTSDEQKKNQINLIIAKLQRSKKKFSKNDSEKFSSFADGKNPDEFINELKNIKSDEAERYLNEHSKVFEFLSKLRFYNSTQIVVSEKKDIVVENSRSFGIANKPEDYLDEFKKCINENMNKIAALNIICTRPKDLTRDDLKKLRIELDNKNFNEKLLNSAWKEVKNEDIAADIITFIRQQALGVTLVNHEERIKNAINKLKSNHSFSKMQLKWLDRIENYLINENILNKDVFETGAFKSDGGYKRINKIFKNNLDNIVSKINDYLYDDRSA